MVSTKPRLLLIVFGTMAVAAVGVLFALDAYFEHERRLNALFEQLRKETTLLSEHVRLSIGAADLMLANVETAVHHSGLDALANDKSSWSAYRDVLERTPQLSAITIADAEGAVRFSTRIFPAQAGINIADREHFNAHLQGEQRFIGRPVVDRPSRRNRIPVSIRLDGPDGDFDGIATTTLNTAYFKHVYGGMIGTGGLQVGIYRLDGIPLSLSSSADENYTPLPHAASERPLGVSGTRSFVAGSGDQKRLVTQRRIDDYPVVVSASYGYSRFLASLYPTWIFTGSIFVGFSTAIMLAIAFINSSIQIADREREAQLSLARRQREAERLSHAIISHFPSGRVLVFNRNLRVVFADGQSFDDDPAHANESMVGRAISELYPSRTRATLEVLAKNALAGAESKGEIARQKRVYKVTAAPLEDDNGEVKLGLMLIQDITEMKLTQQELEVRNCELQELSLTDGLLGIANRRAFDQDIAREWRRAARKRQPLSLLMVDVDFFKRYNDRFGHTIGDVCLQRIAAVLEAVISRPGDLVARYGGEEMAVLLPDCDPEGARTVAERIHTCLAEAAIPFPDSPLGSYITVSIGAKTIIPHKNNPHIQNNLMSLVEAADRALYRAKKSGRHRTVVCDEPNLYQGRSQITEPDL